MRRLLLFAAIGAVALPEGAAAQAQAQAPRLQRCLDQAVRSEGGTVARVVADPSLSLRTEPSLDATIMRSIPDGAPLVVLRRVGLDWLQVVAVDAAPGCVMQLGFVKSDYVR